MALLACAAVIALVAAGCGASSHKTELRAANPITITAYITDNQVRIQPANFGAGTVNFSIANQSAADASFTLAGPVNTSSDSIPAGGTGNLKVDLKAGDYEATAGDKSAARPFLLSVGPERRSAQNDLLLP